MVRQRTCNDCGAALCHKNGCAYRHGRPYEAPARQWHHWSGGSRMTSSLHLGRHQRHDRCHVHLRRHQRHHQWNHRSSLRSHATPWPRLRICTLRSSWQDCEDLEPKCLRIERSNMQWSKTWRIYVCVALCCVVLRCLTFHIQEQLECEKVGGSQCYRGQDGGRACISYGSAEGRNRGEPLTEAAAGGGGGTAPSPFTI